MYLTQINMIRGLTKAEYFQLRELCFFSNCLYNFALYNVRQQFFKDKTYLRFEANYHECKDNDNYKLLQSNMAQQTLRAVDFAFKSFYREEYQRSENHSTVQRSGIQNRLLLRS